MFKCKWDDGLCKIHPGKDPKSVSATALKPYPQAQENHKYWHEKIVHPGVDRYIRMQKMYTEISKYHCSTLENLQGVPCLPQKPENRPNPVTPVTSSTLEEVSMDYIGPLSYNFRGKAICTANY